ncbi:MAG: hypothetical protein U5N26_09535 [Candidatus Marinimicrobia bacterium]|nr:hypothetical protein [Candidatus Neomarinimicrobiota bacterium]
MKQSIKGILIFIFMISMLFGQTYLIDETFGTVPPAGWTEGNSAPTQKSDGGYDDAYALLYPEGSTASIVTSSVTDPDRISFYYIKSRGGAEGQFDVNYSTSSTGPWTNLFSGFPTSNSNYEQSVTELDLSAGTYYFQLIRSDASKKDLYVDLFQVTQKYRCQSPHRFPVLIMNPPTGLLPNRVLWSAGQT